MAVFGASRKLHQMLRIFKSFDLILQPVILFSDGPGLFGNFREPNAQLCGRVLDIDERVEREAYAEDTQCESKYKPQLGFKSFIHRSSSLRSAV